ncbi:hypothetical protein OAY01_03150 [Luminiphilus sp.]|nr:hypothetical protein [Luminiphilus sp.]
MSQFQSFMPRIGTSMLRPFAAACLVAVASLGWTGWAAAAACSSTNYDLNTQAEVDALGATGCDSVSGTVYIRNSTDITNLDGLANITSVGDYLNIYNNSALTNLDGLANLTSVGGALRIYDNAALLNINGLSSLASIGGNPEGVGRGLTVSGNPLLENIVGLSGIRTTGGASINVSNNDMVEDLRGLENIVDAGAIRVIGNNAMRSLTGFPPQATFGDVYVQSNPELVSLSALHNLRSVGTSAGLEPACCNGLWIGENNSLVSLDGLENLEAVGGFFSIESNPILSDISALANLQYLTGITFYPIGLAVTDNPLLSDCSAFAPMLGMPEASDLESALNFGSIGVAIDIGSEGNPASYPTLGLPNGLGCNSVSEVLAGVSGPTEPSILSAAYLLPDQIFLEFSTSTTTDLLFPILEYQTSCIADSGIAIVTSSAASPMTVNDVNPGKVYDCTVAPVTGLGVFPTSDPVSVAVPAVLPSPPVINIADYEDGTIRLTVSVADNGGADITEYSASCTDGTSTFTGTSSTPTIEVTGLTNGTAYTCSASATNAVGSSGASASTDSITPEALPTGLPIWLLYEATK